MESNREEAGQNLRKASKQNLVNGRPGRLSWGDASSGSNVGLDWEFRFGLATVSSGACGEEDIAVCECKYDPCNPESACGESCLNVLTNTECTPGYCHCGEHCLNQKFQKCEYAKTMLFKTEGRGWGLRADQNMKEYNHVWEDGDDRYTVENIPLYDSAEDEPFPGPDCATIPVKHECIANYPAVMQNHVGSEIKLEETSYSVSVQDAAGKSVVTEKNKEIEFSLEDKRQVFSQTNAMISRIRSNSACRNYNIGPSTSSKKRSQQTMKQKTKPSGRKHVSSKPVAQLFASKKAQEEITRHEELKNKATSELNSLYDEIRPAIEEHERDSQDSVSTSVAEKWIEATCSKWKAEFEFHFSIVKNVMCPPKSSGGGEDVQNEMKYLTN
ncbi:hypothetical protein DH2020_047610 [Rehmannia glutinosa]|uniref:AWS domain-containing protein n=1 Tax=Rehmannia glutinosa TaxID=99300 RepID=A0ABR0U7Y8_REHGL